MRVLSVRKIFRLNLQRSAGGAASRAIGWCQESPTPGRDTFESEMMSLIIAALALLLSSPPARATALTCGSPHGWCSISHFDHENSMLNVAFPSYASYYFGAIVPRGEQWMFSAPTGEGMVAFPGLLSASFFTSSIAVYSMQNGMPLPADCTDLACDYWDNTMANFDASLEQQMSDGMVLPVEPVNASVAVLLRFYVDDRHTEVSTAEDLYKYLFIVRDATGRTLDPAPMDIMQSNSAFLERSLRAITSREVVPMKARGETLFTFDPSSNAGQYPDPTNYYLQARPSIERPVVRMTGKLHVASMQLGNSVRYLDVLAASHSTTATDDALPFTRWRDHGEPSDALSRSVNFEIWIAPHGVPVPPASYSGSSTSSSRVLRWSNQTAAKDRMVLLRVIDVSCFQPGGCTGIAAAREPLDALASKEVMGDLYPNLEYFEADS